MPHLKSFWLGRVDLAPLCAFRVLFGLQLLNWFWQLFPNLSAFFTDEGILPRHALLIPFADRPSLLNVVGEWWQVAIFWGACLLVALMLTVGWHTRTAAILAFLGVVSFSWRNPLILDGSDFVFRMIPFWLAFTDAGALWSIDAVLRRRRGEPSREVGAALPVRILELQVGWIHLMTGLEKLAGSHWIQGTAAYYALQLEHTFGRSYAQPIAAQPLLVRLMTWGTLAVELAFLPLSATPSSITRLAAVAGGIALHGGILVLMNVGNFPVVMLSTLVLFLPPRWIRAAVDRLSSAAPKAVGVAATSDSSDVSAPNAPSPATPPQRRSLAAAVLLVGAAIAAFATALPSYLAAYRPDGDVAELLRFLSIDQRWDMFSPNPAQVEGWIRAPARLADGTELDLFTGKAPSDEPRWADPLYSRWVKVHERITSAGYSDYRLEYARSFCRLRNLHVPDGQSRLDTFELYYVERAIQPPGEPPTLREHLIWSHQC